MGSVAGGARSSQTLQIIHSRDYNRFVTMNADQFAIQQSQEFIQRLFHRLRRAFFAQTPEAVHQLRTDIRRFLQASATAGSGGRESKRLLRGLKEVLRLAGNVRDCDVAYLSIGVSTNYEPCLLQARPGSRRKGDARILREALKSWVSQEAFEKWKPVLDAGMGTNSSAVTPIRESAEPVLTRLTEAFLREGIRASKRDTAAAEDLHRLTIVTEQLRYSFEFYLPILSVQAHTWITRLKSVQSLLGDINDCRIVRSLVRKAGGNTTIDVSLKRRQSRKTDEVKVLLRKEFPKSSGEMFDSIRQIC